MLRDIDYIRNAKLISYTDNLNEETINLLTDAFQQVPQIDSINFKNKTIEYPSLVKKLNDYKLFQSFIDTSSDNVPLDVYLYSYFKTLRLKATLNYKSLLKIIKDTSIYKEFRQVHEFLEFFFLAYNLNSGNFEWKKFTENFDGTNWNEIDLLAKVLPLSDAKLDEFIFWISLIIEKQEKDGALGEIGHYVYEWIIMNENISKEIEDRLTELATNNCTNRFFTPLLKGLKEKQKKDNIFYILKLSDFIDSSNAFNVLYAVGTISLEDDKTTTTYYDLLIKKLNDKNLAPYEFINLCNYFKLYRKEMLSNIEDILPTSENPEFLNAVITLLKNDEENKINKDWKNDAYFLLFSKNIAVIKNGLNYLLHSIADTDIQLAYDLFEHRIKIMAHLEMLETAFVYIVQQDVVLFQNKLISWLNQEDDYLHIGIRKICSLHELGKSLFEIPANIFEKYCVRDKLYISYKVIGHVYSMDALQRLILSLIKSIKAKNEILKESMHYILFEYLVYNYRTTLQLERIR